MLDPLVVYRRIDPDQHLVDAPDGVHKRIASLIFRDSNGVSVDDGALATAAAAAAQEPGCGVLALPKSALQGESLTLTPAPINGNAAHCEIGSPGDRQAKRLARQGIIVIPPAGYTIDVTGKMLVPPSTNAAAGATAPTTPPPPATPPKTP